MPAINKPNQHFDVLTWSGTGGGSGATRSITGLNFQPDLIWEKSRTSGTNHQVLDSVRGVGQNKTLATNSTGTEPTPAGTESLYGWLSAINSDGFTLTNGTSTFDNWNKSGDTYVAWTFKAGGTAVTNTNGTISSQVSANPTAGFSVVTWTGNGSASATVGHGLGAVPAMIICKERSGTDYWHVKHKSHTSTNNSFLNVVNKETSAASVGDGVLGDLSSNTTFGFATAGTPGNVVAVNESGITNVAYCWSEIDGYSKFGIYTGNSGTDGPFVYLGFRPRWLMIKRNSTASVTYGWQMYDTARQTYNSNSVPNLWADTAATEGTGNYTFDLLSNGFKLRSSGVNENNSGDTYIYAAFAEAPFKFANGR
jgi:hypothetical protein